MTAIEKISGEVYLKNGRVVDPGALSEEERRYAYKGTIAYGILDAHNRNKPTVKGGELGLKFDCLASHDITYVGVIQTAKACNLEKFPVPYVLTNCHNSLCAVGGTVNADDHNFGYSAVKKYGGIYVPANSAVIHTYMRERMAGCGKMILGSDSHTRYGALGTLGIGEGGGELAKQLLGKTYDIKYPGVTGVELKGSPGKGVGPQDVALTLVKAVFGSGFVKNNILEFFGSGVKTLPIEYRNGIDVMTTEAACLSSIWVTDDEVLGYLTQRNRGSEFRELKPANAVCYDGLVVINLNEIEPMIALPFHPSNAYTIREFLRNPRDILAECEKAGRGISGAENFKLLDKTEDGKVRVDQAVIAGCAGGTFDNIAEAAAILKGKSTGRLDMSVYPGSKPIFAELLKKGVISDLINSGVTVGNAFCGPCFGACDVPGNNGFSIRHTTRNFEAREGSRPAEGQLACVALMDARSIAATAAAGGCLTSAADAEYEYTPAEFHYDDGIYRDRVTDCFGAPDKNYPLRYGPNITDWPKFPRLAKDILLRVAAVIDDPVTTTDELIPSGEISSYRSNPERLAEFTLSRKRPDYVGLAKDVRTAANSIGNGKIPPEYARAMNLLGLNEDAETGSAIYAEKPGDGSAREQAASCQRVLGGLANFAGEYATKRYRSNLINWGILPFLYDNSVPLQTGDFVAVKNAAAILDDGEIEAELLRGDKKFDVILKIGDLTEREKEIIKAGCLINFYGGGAEKKCE